MFVVVLIILLSSGIYRNLKMHQNEIDFKRHVSLTLGIHADSTIVEMIENVRIKEYVAKIDLLKDEFRSGKALYTFNARERGEEMFSSIDSIIEIENNWENLSTKEKSIYLVELHGVKIYLLSE